MNYQFHIEDFFPKMQPTNGKRPATPHFRRKPFEPNTLLPVPNRAPVQYQSHQQHAPPATSTISAAPAKRNCVPVQTAVGKLTRTYSTSTLNLSTQQTQASSNAESLFDPSLKVVTGNVERICESARDLKGTPAVYELFAMVLCSSQGRFPCEKLVVLRNQTGRVLQGVFYEISAIPYFPYLVKGDFVRCVGHISENRIHIAKIAKVTQAAHHHQRMADRLQSVGRHVLKRSLSSHNLNF